MTVYQPPELAVDRDAIHQDIVDAMQAAVPGLTVQAGTPEWAIASSIADRHAEALELLMERAEGDYAAMGQKVFQFPMRVATQATTTVTITNVTSVDQVLDANTQIGLSDGAGGSIAFQTPADVTIPANGSASVTIVAVTAGAAGTGLYLSPQLEQTQSWVGTLTVDAPATGGQDGETEDEYVDRFSAETTLLSDTLVTPDDFQTYAQQQDGVGRALAIDLYDASTSTAGVGGHVTVAIVADDGSNVSSGIKTTVNAVLAAKAITNMAIHVIDPARTAITVAFAAVKQAPYDATDVQARAVSAVLDVVDPANFARPSFGDELGPQWVSTTKLRFQDVSAALNNVEGLDHWTTLTLNGATSDITLSGIAPLPSPNPTVSGTVT